MIARPMASLRFALLFDGDSLERWHVECLDRLEDVAQLAAVIFAPAERREMVRRRSPLRQRYARWVGERSTSRIPDRLRLVPRFGPDGFAAAGSARFDFILKLGSGAIPDELERAIRLGVWSFEHELENSELPFFREVHDGDDVTRAALIALTDDGPSILEEGFFRTDPRSYVASRDAVLAAIAGWPARVGGRILAGAVPRAGTPRPSSPAAPASMLRYFARAARSRLELAWQRLFRHPQWNVGILDMPVGALVTQSTAVDERIEWLPLAGRKTFLADPFGVERDGALHILCECFRYKDSRGHICTLEILPGGAASAPVGAIEPPIHVSYPFLLEADDGSGDLYCVPETARADEVALFRADAFPRRWSKVSVLVSGFAGVDPTLFRHEGRWWLMCTRRGGLEDVELWAWHAPSLGGPWTAHAQNPIKTDVRGSRPGGRPFRHDGDLYRPAQDCSRAYGWRVAIQKVVELTPTEFVEEQVAVLEASPRSPFPRGRHTLTPVGDRVLVDGRRDVFVWAAFRAFVKIWAADVAAKLRRRHPHPG